MIGNGLQSPRFEGEMMMKKERTRWDNDSNRRWSNTADFSSHDGRTVLMSCKVAGLVVG